MFMACPPNQSTHCFPLNNCISPQILRRSLRLPKAHGRIAALPLPAGWGERRGDADFGCQEGTGGQGAGIIDRNGSSLGRLKPTNS